MSEDFIEFTIRCDGRFIRVQRFERETGDWRSVPFSRLKDIISETADFERLYTAGQVGRLYDRSSKAVTLWIRQGRLEAIKVPSPGQGGSWRIPTSALEDFEPPKRGRKYMWERTDDDV